MPRVPDALRQHAGACRAKFELAMPIEHKRVLAAITRCRTGELGHLLYQCESCRRQDRVGRSCVCISRADQRQPHCVVRRDVGDVQVHAYRFEPLSDSDGERPGVPARLLATRLAATVSESALLRIRQFEFEDRL